MKRGGELFIGQKYTGNKVMLLFRNKANQLVLHVLAFNDKLLEEPLMGNPFFE